MLKIQAVWRGRGSRFIPVATFEYIQHAVRMVTPSVHIAKRADDDAYHIMKKGVSPYPERDKLIISINRDGIDPSRGAAISGYFFTKRGEIKLANKMRRGRPEIVHIEGMVHPHGTTEHEGAPLTAIVNEIEVFTTDGIKACIETGRYGIGVLDRDIAFQNPGKAHAEPLELNTRGTIQMCHLTQGMYTGIRSPGRGQPAFLPGKDPDGPLDFTLDGSPAVLNLPAFKPGSVVLNQQRYSGEIPGSVCCFHCSSNWFMRS